MFFTCCRRIHNFFFCSWLNCKTLFGSWQHNFSRLYSLEGYKDRVCGSMYPHIMANTKIVVTYHFFVSWKFNTNSAVVKFSLCFCKSPRFPSNVWDVCLQRLHQQVLQVLSISVEIQILNFFSDFLRFPS